MTFLRQIQDLFERTYTPTGVNLEDCLIDTKRCLELSNLAGPLACDLSMEGRTFFRIVDGKLYLAIYYHPAVIAALEQYHPMQGLSHHNIRPLITFLEELNHAVHASLLFLEHKLDTEREDVLYNLELQAKIDTYLTLKLIITVLRERRHVLVKHERWIQNYLFKRESFNYQHVQLANRYKETNQLGFRLIKFLDQIDAQKRVEIIRELRPKSFAEKKDYISAL
jgi:hypothetical protein